MKAYRYKLYSNARRGELNDIIYRFGIVRNYAVKMFQGYYKLTGKTLSAYQLSNHIAKTKKNQNRRTAKMVEGLPSQAVQECGMSRLSLESQQLQRWEYVKTMQIHRTGCSATENTNERNLLWKLAKNCLKEVFAKPTVSRA